jgi:hypothetical protein
MLFNSVLLNSQRRQMYCIGPGTGAMDPEAYVGDGGSLPKELVRRQGIVVAYAAAYGHREQRHLPHL